ncbi:bacteriophage N4 adsorption protein B [Pseudomonas aeruginosa]|nr:bacteriophage N4 adsorption protein B [Pseudomonas aeruginosa]
MSNQQHSRLGQILINKGLISAAQLDAAIQAQLSNHKRLGETLIEQGLLSERQLKKALKKQTNLRLAATLVAALLSPFQMASADIQRMQPPAAMSRQELPKNLRPLTDVEMSNVNARASTKASRACS